MPSFPDFNLYEVLEVTRDASLPDITAPYRRLARLYHPDKNLDNDGATAKFQKVQAAYEILSDERQRRAYDQPESSSPFGGEARQQNRAQEYYKDEDDEMDEIDEMIPNPFQYASFETEKERRRHEARMREEEAARAAARLEKTQREATEEAKRVAEAKAKKAMEDAAAASKQEAETQSRLKMEDIFVANGCVTDAEKQACCEHCSFWPKEQMKRKLKCLNCGKKKSMTQYKCPYCALALLNMALCQSDSSSLVVSITFDTKLCLNKARFFRKELMHFELR
ncbi:7235a5a4-53d5-4885-bb07-b090dfc87b95 [Sclerotinia trifoliorum]|uniref:7235a5a4-53d5-4885-bb07-b090dfc87b95 n=1 Tax=Sclerotinia trifoliorum TaxID=28548 RepID=A0A8H2VMY2_9HELO|nr:7235a5a4-53d5-4885-bb07-b090dfc87b95 [Sclerotinia trifoliorum]